jgi:hypothetical protein
MNDACLAGQRIADHLSAGDHALAVVIQHGYAGPQPRYRRWRSEAPADDDDAGQRLDAAAEQ